MKEPADRIRFVASGLLMLCLSIAATGVSAELQGELNRFSLEEAIVDVREIIAAGPGRDSIPALVHPEALSAADSPWADDVRVIGVEVGGEARAYPLAVLNWHELVNDTLGGLPILVSYCPLCATAMVFDRILDRRTRQFGVSGLLYRSDLLLYDRQTESLWSQIAATAVAGELAGKKLNLLRSRQQRWVDWLSAHPNSTILSPSTGHVRNYARDPYASYAQADEPMFPVATDERYPAKVRTLGLRLADGRARAYPAPELMKAGGRVSEWFGGHKVEVGYDAARAEFDVSAPGPVAVVEGYWFAWLAFHPDSEVFVAIQPTREAVSPEASQR
jgi:hypothetical protein